MECELPSYFSLLPTADCLLPSKGRRSPAGRDATRATPALCLLLTAECLLRLREAGWRRFLAGMAPLDKMSVPSGKERTSNFKNRTNDAGMSLKTKDRCGKLGGEAGMSMKTEVLSCLNRECC